MKSSNLQIQSTSDGSATLFHPELNETYHSLHGALSESYHVYIQNGLNLRKNDQIQSLNLLEIGLGTGLNLLLTLLNRPNGLNINYTSIEPFPLSQSVIQAYYADFTQPIANAELMTKISELPAFEWHELESDFNFRWLKSKIQDLSLKDLQADYDLVYFDAFAPSRQPEMWTPDVLELIYASMRSKGVLTTYCAQGQFKRNLKLTGFDTQHPKGANGKREMTIAIKP